MCDLHSQVTREVMVPLQVQNALAPGHPLDTFKRENEALQRVLADMRSCMTSIQALAPDQDLTPHLLRFRQALNDLMDVDKHYQRKEHALFSCLERHGITGPSKVMWAKDDDARLLLKQLSVALRKPNLTAGEWNGSIVELANSALSAVQEMIYKEENILFPMARTTLTEAEWAEIWQASPQYGWCLVDPREGYQPKADAANANDSLPRGTVALPTGNISVEQLAAVFSTLPLDLTFVDANDRVAFFTEGPSRIFARSRAIIGRKVQNCHPPSSVEIVDRILDDFREGRQNVAEFWIKFQEKFVHIRYFAVRDKQRTYLGTLELTQDIAPLKALEGERRLLQYGPGN